VLATPSCFQITQASVPLLNTFHRNGPQKWLQKIDGINQAIIRPAAEMMKDVRPVRIAVLDTGLNLAHSHFMTYPSEMRRIKGHWQDFVESQKKPVDEDKGQHGTMVALLLLRVAKHAEIFIARIASTSSELQGSGDNIAKVCPVDDAFLSFLPPFSVLTLLVFLIFSFICSFPYPFIFERTTSKGKDN
jgi:hypothetical protein